MGAMTVFRLPAIVGFVAIAGCRLLLTPDLHKDEAVRTLMADSTFRGMERCDATSPGSSVMKRTVLEVTNLARNADSEADCCYAAEVDWRWEAEGNVSCSANSKRFRSHVEFRYRDKWEFFSLYGAGISGSIDKPSH
jgi:hypothetical protein